MSVVNHFLKKYKIYFGIGLFGRCFECGGMGGSGFYLIIPSIISIANSNQKHAAPIAVSVNTIASILSISMCYQLLCIGGLVFI